MNWIDLVIIAALILFIFEGFGRPLFWESIELVSFLLSFLFSLRFYNPVARTFEATFLLPHSLANVLGFVAVWYVVEIIFFILSQVLSRYYQKGKGMEGEKFLSMVPAFLKGLIVIALILVLVATFPIKLQIKRDVEHSKIGSVILSATFGLEAPLKNIFGGLAHDTLTFLTIYPKTNESVALGFQTNDFSFDEKLEFTMISLVNKERMTRGIPPLSFDPNLRQIAQVHSGDMFKKGYFSHINMDGEDVADRAGKAGIEYLVIGENLAYAPTLEIAHQGLMNSPEHRANILSEDFHKIGIGVANGGDFGFMITQIFKN